MPASPAKVTSNVPDTPLDVTLVIVTVPDSEAYCSATRQLGPKRVMLTSTSPGIPPRPTAKEPARKGSSPLWAVIANVVSFGRTTLPAQRDCRSPTMATNSLFTPARAAGPEMSRVM